MPALSPAEGPDLALDGLRVIDLSQGIAGPFCTKLLADFGAEVIKVELADGRDVARSLGPFPDDIPHPDRSGLFVHLNTNKKSLTLDITTQSGRVVLRKLLAKADVLVESYPPGYLRDLELGHDALKDGFPNLVYCSITPFGQTGPYRDFKGNSLTCMALSGLMYVTGDPDKEPLSTGGEAAEWFAGLAAWVAVLAAVEQRARSGRGDYIDVSMLESLGAADEYNTALYSFTGAIRKRFYSRHQLPVYPMEIYPCRDGRIVVVPGGTGFPTSMALLLEQPELEQNPLFQNPWLRMVRWQEFEEILRPYLMEHDWEDLLTRAQELRMPFSPVLDPQQLLENQHLKERGFFQDIDQPELGRITMTGPPFRMSETPGRTGPAPLLDEHGQEVLLELGYDRQDTVILRERGIT
ncbi:MAG: CoA transferase [Chloroflexi bacterium]|nr:CoA transferase [Chloroflexota bacterium]